MAWLGTQVDVDKLVDKKLLVFKLRREWGVEARTTTRRTSGL